MAGPITTLSGSMSINLATTCTRTDPLLGKLTVVPSLGIANGFTSSATPPSDNRTVNQDKYFTLTIAPSGTVNLDLSLASVNVVGDATATLAKVTALAFLLPLVTQIPSLNLTVQSSSVTVGNAAATGNKLFLTSATAMTFELTPGRSIAMLDEGTSFVTVDASNKIVKFVNNDAVNAATVVIRLIGTDT